MPRAYSHGRLSPILKDNDGAPFYWISAYRLHAWSIAMNLRIAYASSYLPVSGCMQLPVFPIWLLNPLR